MHRRNPEKWPLSSSLLQYFCRPRLAIFEILNIIEFFSQYLHESYWADQILAQDQWLERSLPGNQRGPIQIIRKWAPGEATIRLDTVPPRLSEMFSFQAFTIRKSAYSYEDLRTVDNNTYHTFREAAKAIKLFENKNEGTQATQEPVENL